MNKKIKYLSQLSKSLSSVFVSDAVFYVLTALFSIAYGRLEGKSALGLFSYAFVIATMVRTIMDAGYELEITRSISNNPQNGRKTIENAQLTKNYIWLILTPIAVIAGFLRIGSWEFLALLAWNYFVSLSATFRSAFRGLGRMNDMAKIEAVCSIALYSINFPLLFLYPKLELIFSSYLIIEVFKGLWYKKSIHSSINLGKYFDLLRIKYKFGGKSFFGHFKEQLNLIGISLLSILQYRAAFLVLSAIGTPSQMGKYSSSRGFITIMKIIPGTFLNTLLPEFSKRKAESKKSNLIIISLLALVIGIIVSLLLWIFSKPLMMITYGFEEAVSVLKVFSWTFLPLMMHITWESYLLSINLEHIINRCLLISVVLLTIFAIFLSYNFGAIGSAYAVLIGESVLALLYAIIIVYNKKRFYN